MRKGTLLEIFNLHRIHSYRFQMRQLNEIKKSQITFVKTFQVSHYL